MSQYIFWGGAAVGPIKNGTAAAQNNKPPQFFVPAQILRGEAIWPPSPFPPKKNCFWFLLEDTGLGGKGGGRGGKGATPYFLVIANDQEG